MTALPSRRRPAVAAAAALLAGALALLVSPAAPAQAAASTCRGRAATLVGTPGQSLQGTSGPDVIVTNGASTVFSGGGADLICVAGARGNSQTFVYAQTPQVTVDASKSPVPTLAQLAGGDTFVGGRYADDVSEYDAMPGSPTNHISTAGGNDIVTVGYAAVGNTPAYPGNDVVSLGTGNDTVYLDDGVDGGRIDGGPGHDVVGNASRTAFAWTVDFATSELTASGISEPMVGFEGLDSSYSWSGLRVVGTKRAETWNLSAVGADATRAPVRAALGGGDDRVQVVRGARGVIDGDSGHNTYVAEPHYRHPQSPAKVALRSGAIGNARGTVSAHGFHRVDVLLASSAEVVGTNQADSLHVNACSAHIMGLGGNDSLRLSLPSASGFCEHPPTTRGYLYGGGGDDGLSGTGKRDVLIGGPGRDHIDGRGGGDRCVGERTVAC